MGPTERAVNRQWQNVQKVRQMPMTHETLMMLAILANQQVLARALDRLGTRVADNDRTAWSKEDFLS